MAKKQTYRAFVARPSRVLDLSGELLDSAPVLASLVSEIRDISAYATYIVRNDEALGDELSRVTATAPADAGRRAGVNLPDFLAMGKSGRSRKERLLQYNVVTSHRSYQERVKAANGESSKYVSQGWKRTVNASAPSYGGDYVNLGCQHFEHVTVPAGEAEKIMEEDNAANTSGFSRARAMRVMPGSVLTALNPESLGITDMSVYGKSGKPLTPVVAGTRFNATESAEKAASKYGVTIDGAIQDAKTRNRIMREVLKNAVAEKFLPRKVKYKVSGAKYGQMKIAISVPGDYDNPQFNTWRVSCRDIAGKNGAHDPGYVSVERVPSATGLELRERVRDVALSVFGSYEAGEGDGQWHPYCDVDVEIVGADAKDDPSAYYEYQRFTDDERRELSRIWELVEPEPVRGVIAHCETAHPGKRRKRPYNRYIRGRVVEREPFTWFEN